MSTVLVYTPGRRAVDNPRSAGQMRLACVVRHAPQIPGRCRRRWPLGPAWNRRQVVAATARRKSMVAARRVLRSNARGVRAVQLSRVAAASCQSAGEQRQRGSLGAAASTVANSAAHQLLPSNAARRHTACRDRGPQPPAAGGVLPHAACKMACVWPRHPNHYV